MTFHVGQKIECVNAKGQEKWLVKGAIYQITSIWEDCLRIDGSQAGHFSWRFRPIVSRKTEIFTDVPADLESERWDNRRKIGIDA